MGQNYAEALRKLIPAEVLVFYFSLVSAMPEQLIPNIALTFVSVLITPFYLWYAGNVKIVKQIVVSTLSILLYAVMFGSLSNYITEDYSWIPTLVAMTWTFLMPLLFIKVDKEN